MFSGYYKQPDKTAEAWDGGAFHTGDMGYEDEDGYFYLVNLGKDYLRQRGETMFGGLVVSCNELYLQKVNNFR